MSSLQPTVQLRQFSDEEIAEIRKHSIVLGVHETPPTAAKDELWDGPQVASAFRELMAARVRRDLQFKGTRVPAPQRAVQIVDLTSKDRKFWLEFRRIYPTFWKAALWRETSEEDAQQLLLLISQLDDEER